MAKKKHQPQQTTGGIPWERAGIVALLVVFFLHARQFIFIQDDAFITFRYIRNFISGNGLVWNIGEKVEGYTTFLWTMLLAIPAKLGFDLITTSQYLGVACALAAMVFVFLVSRQISGRTGLYTLIAVALLAVNSSAAYWAISGMETALFTFLLILSIWLYFRERQKTFAYMPFAFALLTLCRPEGMFLFGLTVLYEGVELFTHPEGRRAKIRQLVFWCILYGIPVGIFMIGRYAYYGWFFPNTYYAKAGISKDYFAAGLSYLELFAEHYLLWGLLLVLPIVAVVRARFRGPRSYLGFLLLAYTAYVVTVGGDVLPAHRFFIPVLPLLYLLVQEGLRDIHEILRQKSASLAPGVWLATAAIIGATYVIPKDYVVQYWQLENGLVEGMTDTALWLRAHSRPGAVMAASTIGAVGYYSDLPLVDMLGLTDATIAHYPEQIFGVQSGWRERNYNVSYVLSRKPDWILFSTGIKPSAFAERALFTREEFRRWYYPYYFHPAGDMSDVRVVYRRSEEPVHPDTVADAGVNNDFINQYYDGMNRTRRWPKEAMEYFQKSLATAPSDFAQLYQEIGNLYRGANNQAEATKYYERALASDPRLVDSRMMLGFYARSRGDMQEARRHFEMLTKYNPEFSTTWTLLGEAQAALGDTAAAKASLQRALEVARNNDEAARQLLQLQRR